MLYAFTVFCLVYLMRKNGVKLDAEAIKATAAIYRLTCKKPPIGQPVMRASLYDVVSGEEKHRMEPATIRLIDEGIKISGSLDSYGTPQLWWCVPLAPEQNAELQAQLKKIKA